MGPLGLLWLCFLCCTCWKGHEVQRSPVLVFLLSLALVLWTLAQELTH